MSQLMMSEGAEAGKSGYPLLGLGNTFAFKFVDLKGRVNRFNFGECCRLYCNSALGTLFNLLYH